MKNSDVFVVDEKLTRRIEVPHDSMEDIVARRSTGNKPLYSTGAPGLDDYLFGGYGMPIDYEMLLLYGDTGLGKSTVALNLLRDPIISGVKVGLICLEDKNSNVVDKLSIICGDPELQQPMWRNGQIRMFPQEAKQTRWTLDRLLIEMEEWFNTGIEIILLDHLQWTFDIAAGGNTESINQIQKDFMQKLNILMSRVNKTVILISHVNKGSEKGMNKVQGSHALVEIPSKVIELNETDQGELWLRLRKTRWTRKRHAEHMIRLDGFRLRDAAYQISRIDKVF